MRESGYLIWEYRILAMPFLDMGKVPMVLTSIMAVIHARATVILADVIAVVAIAGAVVGILETAKGKPVVAEAKGEALAIVVVFNDDGPRHDSAVVLKEGVVVAVYVSVL